ncbi:MAG TPA: methylmalonyl Co-A mutase-associated GTPase MeaB, partial [Rugosimonospora sp.]|nr:methylmalonyl Co-A mutase-associated GTPase MeaB [Rugosimonospora sp.]
LRGGTALARLATAVAAGELDPYAAARNLLAGLEVL